MNTQYERTDGVSGTWTDLLQISPQAIQAIFGQGVRDTATDIARMSAFYDIAMKQAINQYLQAIREQRTREAQAQIQSNAIIAQAMHAAKDAEERAKIANLQMNAAAFEGLGYLITESLKHFKKQNEKNNGTKNNPTPNINPPTNAKRTTKATTKNLAENFFPTVFDIIDIK
ncbi:MAG: hypothetical protein KatS3mg087_1759 [Patescibacteria group bacterium]|nr:MAG: hypothetical protein KatS3mg087_1759 [Patescibacteria group bacterium]